MMKKKVLPALALAFLVLLGSEMTVFSAEYCIDDNCTCGKTHLDLQVGTIVSLGDTIYSPNERFYFRFYDGADLLWEIGNDSSGTHHIIISNWGYPATKWQYAGDRYFSDIHYYNFIPYVASETDPASGSVSGQEADPVSGQEADPMPVSAGNAVSHEHYYEWVEAYEPSVSGDGLMQHRCSCGSVDDQYTVPAAVAYLQTFCTDIQNAPENAVVEWKPEMFRCYTRRMMEELAKRPDVTLITTYTEADGTTKSFTIPAGQALVDDELFYGFTYLGNLYGWN